MRGSNYSPELVAVTTSETLLCGADLGRDGLIIYNLGSDELRIYVQGKATAYIPIPANSGYEFEQAPTNAIYGVAATSSTNASVWDC